MTPTTASPPSSSTWDRAIEHVLRWEGGWVDDHDDMGGETRYGISREAHPETWRDGPPTEQQAREIYRNDYWGDRRVQAGKIQEPRIALYLLDCAVNHGPSNGAKLLQRAIIRCGGDISVDGWAGPKTRQALDSLDVDDVLDRFALVRVEFYRQIVENDRTQTKFLHGWINRTLDPLDL